MQQLATSQACLAIVLLLLVTVNIADCKSEYRDILLITLTKLIRAEIGMSSKFQSCPPKKHFKSIG